MILEAMIDLDELQLAARNHGMPLELLREPITPAGLHYLLIHFDIPHVDAGDVAARDRRARAGSRCRSRSPTSARARRGRSRSRSSAPGTAAR